MTKANRTDVYPEFPYFTPEERGRINTFLREMEGKYGPLYPPFQITPSGSTEYTAYDNYKKLKDLEVTVGVRARTW